MEAIFHTMCQAVLDNDFVGLEELLQTHEPNWAITWKQQKSFDLTDKQAPLHLAVCKGKTNMVTSLVEAGFDVNSFAYDADGSSLTCLHTAIGNSDSEMISLLLKLGADYKKVGTVHPNFKGNAMEMAKAFDPSGEALVIFQDYKNASDELDLLRKHVTLSHKMLAQNQLNSAYQQKLDIHQRITKTNQKLKMVTHTRDKARRTYEVYTRKVQRAASIQETSYHECQRLLHKIDMAYSREIERIDQKTEMLASHRESLIEDGEKFDKVIHSLETDLNRDSTTEEPAPKETDSKHNCPICYDKPQTVFVCTFGTCEYWLCGSCLSNVDRCPQCSRSYDECIPKRSRAIERLLNC